MSISNEWKSLDKMIKNKETELKLIVQQKKREIDPLIKKKNELENKIRNIIKVSNLTHYEGIRLEDLKAPKVKKDKINRELQLAKLRQMGIRNPEAALQEIGL